MSDKPKASTFTVERQIQVPLDKLACTLVSAFEGGIRNWAGMCESKIYRDETPACPPELADYKDWPYSWYPLVKGGYVVIPDRYANGKRYILDRASVRFGLGIMAQEYTQHFADLMSESNQDAITADVLIQCCIFGEIKY